MQQSVRYLLLLLLLLLLVLFIINRRFAMNLHIVM
jgi:hypothetical protein